MTRRLAAFAICVLVAGRASAQDRGDIYAVGGLAVTHQQGPSGESPETYVTAPGGTTRGWLIGGGVFVTSAVALDVEVSSTGWMESRQPSRYFMTFNEHRRDRFVAIAARIPWPRTGRMRIEPVAGIVFTRPEAWGQTERDAYWLMPPQLLEIEPRQDRGLGTGVGVAAGADLRLGGRHVAVLPSFRLMQSGVSGGRYDDSSEPRDLGSVYPGGYPNWTMRWGVALRVDF